MTAALLDQDLLPLTVLLAGRRVCVLTGAGISTESGIPDYRSAEALGGEGTRARARQPMRFREFVGEGAARRRYWARAAVGWSRVRAASPNPGHLALAALARAGRVTSVVTQNVDGLHERAGTPDVIALHGRLADVKCLACGAREHRDDVQARIEALNPGHATSPRAFAPDGDADLDEDGGGRGGIADFCEPTCLACRGPLKPDVVFFGEDVPRARVAQAAAAVDEADALLVAGSSLAVFSGYRFVRQARKRGVPVVILNVGETRGDPDATLKLEARLGDVLPRLVVALLGRGAASTSALIPTSA